MENAIPPEPYMLRLCSLSWKKAFIQGYHFGTVLLTDQLGASFDPKNASETNAT